MARHSIGGKADSLMNSENYIPLFERNGHDDLSELQNARAVIDEMQMRIQNLEDIVLNLETRLEEQAELNNTLDSQYMQVENKWKLKCADLEKEIDKYKASINHERGKYEKLKDLQSRTERELIGLLKIKYDLMKSNGKGPDKSALVWEESAKSQSVMSANDVVKIQVKKNLTEFLGLG